MVVPKSKDQTSKNEYIIIVYLFVNTQFVPIILETSQQIRTRASKPNQFASLDDTIKKNSVFKDMKTICQSIRECDRMICAIDLLT